MARDVNVFKAIGTGLSLWARNLPLIGGLVLTIWIPGNAAINWVASRSQTDSGTWSDFWFPTILESIFGPICAGAVIYALDRRWQGRQVGYVESMRVGLRCWGRLFITTLVADIFVGLSFLLIIIPGVILALRYSLIDMTVVLEGRSGDSARLRSADLMRGWMWPVFWTACVFGGLMIAVVGGFYVPLDLIYESTTMTDSQYYAAATVIDCVTDILVVSMSSIVFCIYVQASGREKQQEVQDESIPANSTLPPLPKDDGNPYSPPRN